MPGIFVWEVAIVAPGTLTEAIELNPTDALEVVGNGFEELPIAV